MENKYIDKILACPSCKNPIVNSDLLIIYKSCEKTNEKKMGRPLLAIINKDAKCWDNLLKTSKSLPPKSKTLHLQEYTG